MHQDAVPTWGRGPAIGRQGKTLSSLISLASKRRSLSGSALVSVDCLCVAQGCIAGRRGKCSSGEEVQRYTFKRPKPLQIRKYIFGSVFWGLHEHFFRAVEFGVSLFLCFGEADSHRVASCDRASERVRDVRHRSRLPGTVSFSQILKP